MEDNTRIKVQNRDFGSVGYTIPDLNNLHRQSFSKYAMVREVLG